MNSHVGSPPEQAAALPDNLNEALSVPPPPPLSKQVKTILGLFQLIHHGKIQLKSGWNKCTLRYEDYKVLLSQIRNRPSLWGFVDTKIRYDYSFLTETFVLRMPTLLHERFLRKVVKEIEKRLQKLGDGEGADGQSRAFAQKLEHGGSETLVLGNNSEEPFQRSPDAIFQHRDAYWPGVVLEVSYSQKTRDVQYLAGEYILHTDGNVRVVVGLDINYSTKRGTLSIWRPEFGSNEQGQQVLRVVQTLESQVFRDELEQPSLSPDTGLRLELRDFAPDELAQDVTGSFLIDSATLCQFLEEAEQGRQGVRYQRPPSVILEPWMEHAPPEELNSEDEAVFVNEELMADCRAYEEDSPYE